MNPDGYQFLAQSLPILLLGYPGHRPGGLLLSVLLAGGGIGAGLMIALLLGPVLESRSALLRRISEMYVQVVRGLPLILLLLLIHQILGIARRSGIPLSTGTSALVALAVYSSAYQATIVRAGLRSVPVDLIESARLVGSSGWQVYWRIRLRYTLHVMLPAFTGQAISLFKDTSVVVILGVAELMTVAGTVLGSDVRNASHWVGLYLLVGMSYFLVAFGLSAAARRFENRLQIRDLVQTMALY